MYFVQKNELNYEIYLTGFTATVVYSEKASNDVFIPFSITYLHYVYVITCIGKESFKNNDNIRNISLCDNKFFISLDHFFQ